MALGGIVSFSQADFLDLIGRLLPAEYLAPLIAPGPGYEIYQSQAQIGARVSTAILNFQLGSFILTAPDGVLAQAPVLFSRPTAAAGAVTVKAGTVVQTATYGRQFSLLSDVAFGASDLSKPGTVAALFPGEQHNVAGPYVTAGGEAVPGEINQIVTWVQSPDFGDGSITVAQTAGATGGVSSILNMHGADRGFVRGPSEPPATFRQRVRTLPDTVSPQAILDALQPYFSAYPGTQWDFIETFLPTLQEAWDCPSPSSGVTIPPGINTNLFVYDDPRPAYPPYQNRWLDENTFRGAFIVTIPVLAALSDVGLAYDDTAETPAALTTTNGHRAINAYDVPQSFSAALQGFYDGQDYARNAVYAGLYATLQRIKAGGVFFTLEIQGM